MEKIIFDGEGAIFGRMATEVVKELLKGNSVEIINCGEVVVSGDKKGFVEKVNKKRKMGRGGSPKGPKYIIKEDRLVKRMIRGMLPRQKARGRDAFKRLKCWAGVGDLGEDKLKNVKKFGHKMPVKYFQMKDAVRLLKNE